MSNNNRLKLLPFFCHPSFCRLVLTATLITSFGQLQAADDSITWLIQYDGKSAPAAPWTELGKPVVAVESGALSLNDDSKDEMAAFEAEWSGDLDDKEIVVEARVKLVSMVGHRDSPTAIWPQRDGAPICVEVSDGKHVEGILLTPPQDKHAEAVKGYLRTLTDRFAQTGTMDGFHTYRLIIRGEDMAVERDGKRLIEGRDAFWRPAPSPRQFIRFGSTSKPFTGEAQWKFVRLGLRPASAAVAEKSPLKITISEPWPLNVSEKNTEMLAILRTLSFGPLRQTWSHDGGQTWTKPIEMEEGSVAPDMILMSNGVLACSYGRPGSNLMLSTDRGQTWIHHTVITDSGGFNYTALREVSPGRLLYVHDAPKLKAQYIDVKVTKK